MTIEDVWCKVYLIYLHIIVFVQNLLVVGGGKGQMRLSHSSCGGVAVVEEDVSELQSVRAQQVPQANPA